MINERIGSKWRALTSCKLYNSLVRIIPLSRRHNLSKILLQGSGQSKRNNFLLLHFNVPTPEQLHFAKPRPVVNCILGPLINTLYTMYLWLVWLHVHLHVKLYHLLSLCIHVHQINVKCFTTIHKY